jgi:hypothetical protein
MIPAMQVGLFFQQKQTIRNFLAAALGVPQNFPSPRWQANDSFASAAAVTSCS